MSKILPCACNKGYILTRFNNVATNVLREIIYEAIVESRSYTVDEAKKVKKLFKSEVKTVMIAIGEYEEVPGKVN